MPSFPVMHQASPGSVGAFIAIVWTLIVGLWLGSAHASRVLGETPEIARAWSRRLVIGLVLALLVSSLLPASGVLRTYALPPPLGLFAVGSLVLVALLARSGFGARLAQGLPLVALVGAQAFRLPLELVLHAWYEQGVIPEQMTYTGHNFDIVTGASALALTAYMLVSGREPRAAIWAFNLLGSVLLAAVTTIAILSSPLPIRVYTADPPLLLAVYFPYAWIVPFCVGGALFGHIVTFRRLLAAPAAVAS